MSRWEITLDNKTIRVSGKTLTNAVQKWAKRQKNGTSVSCGLLVRVLQLEKPIKCTYWSGEEFMRCFD